MATPTSSPTPLTVTVTAPPATVPSTVCSARRSWAEASCSCICCACWSRAPMSKPPPPSPSKGFWLIVSPDVVGLWGGSSRVLDLVDHLGAEGLLEQRGAVEALGVGVRVVGVGRRVGQGRVVDPRLVGGRRGARALERLPGRDKAGGVLGRARRLGVLGRRRLGRWGRVTGDPVGRGVHGGALLGRGRGRHR